MLLVQNQSKEEKDYKPKPEKTLQASFSNWLCDMVVKDTDPVETSRLHQRAAFNGLACTFILGKVCYQLPQSAKSTQNRD